MTIRNKIYAILLVIMAVLTLPYADGDATFLVFALIIAIPLFFSQRNWINY